MLSSTTSYPQEKPLQNNKKRASNKIVETLLSGLLILAGVVLGYCLREPKQLTALVSTIKNVRIPFTKEHIEAIHPKTRADFEQTQESIDAEHAATMLQETIGTR